MNHYPKCFVLGMAVFSPFMIAGCDAVYFKTQDVVFIVTDATSGAPLAGAVIVVDNLRARERECPANPLPRDEESLPTTSATGEVIYPVHSTVICGVIIVPVFCNPEQDVVRGSTYCVWVDGDSGMEVLRVVIDEDEEEVGELYRVRVQSVGDPTPIPTTE